jgi:hypothetical protein
MENKEMVHKKNKSKGFIMYLGMVYAMFSIGILGFLVWSQLMALPNSDMWVINFTVGWEDFTLLNTFYSSNVNNFVQSAGNSGSGSAPAPTLIYNTVQALALALALALSPPAPARTRAAPKIEVDKYVERGSSETIRENSFENFRKAYSSLFCKPFEQNDDWLFWFIGFAEGDGCIFEHKGRSQFILTQKDPKVLIEIEKVLGFGKVKTCGNYSRFKVLDNKNCLLLYLLFNGNLVLEHRINQLSKWYLALSQAPKLKLADLNLIEIPSIIKLPNQPSIENS